MGLDMYLYAELYTSENFSPDINKKLLRLTKDIIKDKSVYCDSIIIKKNIGYWRKANQIHKWFVDLSGEEDKCQEIHVSREQLKELLDLCKKVKKNKSKANELLPVQEGFFFGSTIYDKLYFNDIDATIRVIENALKLPDSFDFVYRASW